jgi:hypothetical protein
MIEYMVPVNEGGVNIVVPIYGLLCFIMGYAVGYSWRKR